MGVGHQRCGSGAAWQWRGTSAARRKRCMAGGLGRAHVRVRERIRVRDRGRVRASACGQPTSTMKPRTAQATSIEMKTARPRGMR